MGKRFRTKKDATAKQHRTEQLQVACENFLEQNEWVSEGEYYKILKIGRILEGEAFYHETREVYKVICVEIEYEYNYKFLDAPQQEKGVWGIWYGKCSECAPNVFQEERSGNRYGNGYGDHFDYTKVIADCSDVNISELNLKMN